MPLPPPGIAPFGQAEQPFGTDWTAPVRQKAVSMQGTGQTSMAQVSMTQAFGSVATTGWEHSARLTASNRLSQDQDKGQVQREGEGAVHSEGERFARQTLQRGTAGWRDGDDPPSPKTAPNLPARHTAQATIFTAAMPTRIRHGSTSPQLPPCLRVLNVLACSCLGEACRPKGQGAAPSTVRAASADGKTG